MSIRLICSDIDGTLLQYGRKELEDETTVKTGKGSPWDGEAISRAAHMETYRER